MNKFVERKDQSIRGWEHRFPGGFVFFGSRHSRLEDLKSFYPSLEFSILKQVHGKTCIAAERNIVREADAHFTDKLNLALVVQTADCIPVLVSSNQQILAIHAGWRGVEQNILGESLSKLSPSASLDIFIGPHIGPKSFEVGLDVSERLRLALDQTQRNSAEIERKTFLKHPDPSKVYIDLKQILYQQIYSATGALETNPEVRIHHLDLDTFSHPDLHSYRASKGQTGRLLSFIALHESASSLE